VMSSTVSVGSADAIEYGTSTLVMRDSCIDCAQPARSPRETASPN
jgi:hypothetical protein